MQYTELTRKELQREYTRMTQRYSSYMREPMELDMRAEDPLLGRCENRRAAKHFGTVLARIIPFDAKSEQLTHAASLFAISARLAALESLRGTLLRT